MWAEKQEHEGLLVDAVGKSSVEAFRKNSVIWILVLSLAIKVFKSPRQQWNYWPLIHCDMKYVIGAALS